MLRPRDAVLVGVSGGPDSMALLYILHALAPEVSLQLGVAHLNHGLRPEAAVRDADFVAAAADQLDLPFFTDTMDVRRLGREKRLSVEEAGREARYAFLYGLADRHRYTRIALGHHSDDNAELVLMFLLRGSGALGVSGIPPVRGRHIIRPLIDLKRSEIIRFLGARQVPFVTDRTNTDRRYLRNRIRHDLLPELEKSFSPKASEVINRLSGILRDEDRWMESMIDPIVAAAVTGSGENAQVLSVKKLTELPIAVRRRVFRRTIQRILGDVKKISFVHIEAIDRLLDGGSADRVLHLPRRILVMRRRGRLTIRREPVPLRSLATAAGRDAAADFAYRIDAPGTWVISEIDTRLSLEVTRSTAVSVHDNTDPDVAFFDYDALRFPLTLRNFRAGDRFRPLGMNGSQKVKTFFINRKIDRAKRKAVPILLCRDTIIWVGGHRVDESAKVTDLTENILKATLENKGETPKPESTGSGHRAL